MLLCWNVNVLFYNIFWIDCFDICRNKICDKLIGCCFFGCKIGYWDFICSFICFENCLYR